jgi:hypothetical protein
VKTKAWLAWTRDPLLHFALLGGALFAAYHFLSAGDASAPREIVVTASRVDALAQGFAKTWMRPPTADELRGLVDDYVADEVYYREAIAMGLDRDDSVIRRRLRLKMEFLSDSTVDIADPSDAQLQSYLQQNPAQFAKPTRVSLRQVFVSTERHDAAARSEADRILVSLSADRTSMEQPPFGDSTLLPFRLERATAQDIARTFGSGFVTQIQEAPIGKWFGPVRSTYGLHLVRIDDREPGSVPELAEIRPIVVREWEAAQSAKAKNGSLAQMLSKYRVRVESAEKETKP